MRGAFILQTLIFSALWPVIAQTQHSTWADTTGLRADLHRIEAKLGPMNGIDQLRAIQVQFYSFADKACTRVDPTTLHSGILIVHACVVADVQAIFKGLRQDTFPIAKVIPVNCYGLNTDSTGWDDAASMADNNTSAFNYRSKSISTEHSKHAMGVAIDINPMFNPLFRREGKTSVVQPTNGRYDVTRAGTLTHANILKHIEPYGWSWGGRWPKPQDYQHIEKSHGRCAHFEYRK